MINWENWFQWLLGVVVGGLTLAGRLIYRKTERSEDKLEQVARDLLEHRGVDLGFHAAIESRVAVTEQVNRDVVGRLDRIQDTLDRVIERLPPRPA